MSVPEPVWGLVLAGGKSRRMGSDKASLTQHGETQLSRAVSLLATQLPQVYVSTSAEQANDSTRKGFEKIVDAYEGLGPIAGIMSAMDYNPEVSWLVLACDLPALDEQTITHLLNEASVDHVATAYTSTHDELPEPLCAVYRPNARPVIDQFVADGRNCPRKILINAVTHLLTQPNPGALHNINSPEDLVGTGIEQSL